LNPIFSANNIIVVNFKAKFFFLYFPQILKLQTHIETKKKFAFCRQLTFKTPATD